MARRHSLDRRLALLDEIRNIMDSIKTLARLETQKLAPALPVQQQSLQLLDEMAGDFARAFPLPLPEKPQPLLIVLGAERGMCGEFNSQLVTALDQYRLNQPKAGIVAVGGRLCNKLENDNDVLARLPGAMVVEDIPAVMQQLLDTCVSLLGERHYLSLSLLYHHYQRGEIYVDPLLTNFFEQRSGRDDAALLLNLEPQQVRHGLLSEYLSAAINHACYSSLMAENQRRVRHLENAVNHLDEERQRLVHKRNRLHQEDITNELEIILTADLSRPETSYGR